MMKIKYYIWDAHEKTRIWIFRVCSIYNSYLPYHIYIIKSPLASNS